MTPKSKKALIVIVSLLAIGGGVGYFLWKRKKDKAKAEEEANAKTEADAKTQQEATKNQSSGDVSGTVKSPVSESSTFTFPFKTEAEGNAFRKWVNDKYPSYAKQIKLDVSGKLNSFVQTAWDKYGKDYNKALGKSGFTAGQLLYPRYTVDTAYSYPSKETRNQIGRVKRNGAKSVAKFIRDSNTKGWIVADAIVENYKGVSSVRKGIFLEATNYTTVAP